MHVVGWLRALAHRLPGLRGPLQLAAEVKGALMDRTDRPSLEKFFARSPDPFRFYLEPQRFARACQMLDSVRAGGYFVRAVELGCAEGLFTEMLASRCREVVAADVSETALKRATYRCRGVNNVSFLQWDLRSDELPGECDLVIATGVLEYIRRPAALRRAAERIVRGVAPGGYLLVGTTVGGAGIEQKWWANALLRGTHINRHFASVPCLEQVALHVDECICPFEHVLFRKRPV